MNGRKMTSENQTLSAIRQYVKDSQDEKRRGDATAVVQLLHDRANSFATLEKHFNSFTGLDRFWLYALVRLLLEHPVDRSRFYDARLTVEDDPICRQLILRMQRLRK